MSRRHARGKDRPDEGSPKGEASSAQPVVVVKPIQPKRKLFYLMSAIVVAWIVFLIILYFITPASKRKFTGGEAFNTSTDFPSNI
jgi:hypothetical protein